MRPKFFFPLVPSLTTLIALIILVSLGVWQLARLEWKTALLTQISQNRSLPAVSIDNVLEGMDLNQWQYRKIFMEGKFLHDMEMNLVPKSLKGKPGYHLITPFQLKEGGVILVNRGWVPQGNYYDAVDRPTGTVKIRGTFSPLHKPGFFTPENNYEKREIFYVDAQGFAKNTGIVSLLPLYVILEPDQNKDTAQIRPKIKPDPQNSSSGGAHPSPNSGKDLESVDDGKISTPYPQKVGVSLNISNNHLMYAITWFLLAFAALIIYSIFVYQWNHRLRTLNES